jgi:hypothetical protein
MRQTPVLTLAAFTLAADAAAQSQLPGCGHAAAGMDFVGSRADASATGIFTKGRSDLGPLSSDASDTGVGPNAGFNRELSERWKAGVSICRFGSGIDCGRPFPSSTTSTRSTIAQVVIADRAAPPGWLQAA